MTVYCLVIHGEIYRLILRNAVQVFALKSYRAYRSARGSLALLVVDSVTDEVHKIKHRGLCGNGVGSD